MTNDVRAAIAEHRPALLRHCYRMLGSIAEAEDVVQDTVERAWVARDSYRGDAPIKRWLYTIATNTCLNALKQRRRRALPQLESGPARDSYELRELERSHWITPAADSQLFPNPAEAIESRETVALAFIALLQRLPAKQRAALLMMDVLGWPAREVADTLGLSLSSVNSAVHRARTSVAFAPSTSDEPTSSTLGEFIRAWETHDVDGLVALLRRDVALAMPPHSVWFEGVESVARFFRSPRFSAFWSSVAGVAPTRANGLPAFAFYVATPQPRPHSIMVARFVDGQAADMTVYIGAEYCSEFALPARFDRTVSGASVVMTRKEVIHDD